MPTIYEKLRADIVTAVKARDTDRATKLRTADAAIQKAAMDAGKPIDDNLVTATLKKLIKNLRDAREEFARGNRADLVGANDAEIKVLETYMPAGLDQVQLEGIVSAAIVESGAQSRKEMGKVMAVIKARPDAGLIDMGSISRIIQVKLPA